MPFCTKCGYEIAESVRFCSKCGAAQQGEQNPTQSTEGKPAFWSPTAAVNLAFFLYPLGALIHYKNWKILKEKNKAIGSLIWFLCMLLSSFVLFISLVLPGFWWLLFFFIALVMLIAWYYTSAQSQIKYVKEKYGTEYKKESLLIPILITGFVYVNIMTLLILRATME